MNKTELKICDLTLGKDQHACLSLLNDYMCDPMGSNAPIPNGLGEEIIKGLNEISTYRGFFFLVDNIPVGYATCFRNFSTFAAKPLLNIHDIILSPTVRGKGYGKAFLNLICDFAKNDGCCRVNLEVREDNAVAINTYKSLGFGPCKPNMYFWEKRL